MTVINSKLEDPRVVSRTEWLAARKELLAKEKELTRARDAVSAERRRLPWVRRSMFLIRKKARGLLPTCSMGAAS